jgi:AcrR family transcriptional regulator
VPTRKQEILGAALALADEAGLDAVTMRAVAARVGITPMALYRHVADKGALLDGVLDAAVEGIELPDPALAWDERLRRLADDVRAAGRRHPTVIGLAFSRPGQTPALRRLVGVIQGALAEAGVPEDQHARLERMISTFVVGFIVSEVSGRFPDGVEPFFTREYHADVADILGLVRAAAATSA